MERRLQIRGLQLSQKNMGLDGSAITRTSCDSRAVHAASLARDGMYRAVRPQKTLEGKIGTAHLLSEGEPQSVCLGGSKDLAIVTESKKFSRNARLDTRNQGTVLH